jgi:tetratricopeptide (TPR) repeat protein
MPQPALKSVLWTVLPALVVLVSQVATMGDEPLKNAAKGETLALLQAAAEAAAKIEDPEGASSAYWSVGALQIEAGQPEAAAANLRLARDKAGLVKNRVRRWELMEVTAREEAKTTPTPELAPYVESAENSAQKSAVVSAAAAGLFESGRAKEARELFERAWKMADDVKGPGKEVFYLSLAEDASSAGDKSTAREFYKRFRKYVSNLGSDAELLGLRKLGEAQLGADLKDDAKDTFLAGATAMRAAGFPEGVAEMAGLMASAGFEDEASKVIGDYYRTLLEKKGKPDANVREKIAHLADTMNREGVFPLKVLEMLDHVAADDRLYLLPETAMNLASIGEAAKAETLLPKLNIAEDKVSVMCSLSASAFKAGDKEKAASWVKAALATTDTIEAEDLKREAMLEVAEQQVASGLPEEAQKTWSKVAASQPEFKTAIKEREFFQLVEAKDWDKAMKSLDAMSDSPDIAVLQIGFAAELASKGELKRSLALAEKFPKSNATEKLEVTRLAYEKFGSTLSVEALKAELAKHEDPEVIVSLVIGQVGGFRREERKN